MGTISKSQQESAQNIINNYAALVNGNDADTSSGTVNRDLIDTVGNQVSSVYSSIESVRLLNSLKDAASVTIDGLSPIGLNFGVVAMGATTATGTVWFQKATAPTLIIDFPVGTVVRTQKDITGSSIKFVTTTAAQLSPNTTVNPLNRRYEVSASIVAVLSGSVGNVGPGAINTLDTPNRNIDTVTNKVSTSGGTDSEDPVSYAARIRASTSEFSLGTKAGYISTLLSIFPDIQQIAIAGPGDAALIRAQFGNEADIYLVGASYATFTDTIFYSGQGFEYFKTKPVVSVSTVVGTTTGTAFVLGTDVSFTQDTSLVYGGSVKAFDKLTWISSNRPAVGQNYSVTGQYSLLVNNVQNYLNSENNRFVTADILAKQAQRIGIVVSASVSAFSGYDRTTLKNNIQSALINGLTNYNMGQSVEQSDVVALIGNVKGVAKVGIPLTELRKTTDPQGTLTDPISIATSSYARIDQTNVIVS